MRRKKIIEDCRALIEIMEGLLALESAPYQELVKMITVVARQYQSILSEVQQYCMKTLLDNLQSGQECLLAAVEAIQGDEAYDVIRNYLEEFKKSLIDLQGQLTEDGKNRIIVYGITGETENFLYCIDPYKTTIVAIATEDTEGIAQEQFGIQVIRVGEIKEYEHDDLVCCKTPEWIDDYPFENIIDVNTYARTFLLGGYELSYERMNLYNKKEQPLDGVVTGLSYMRQSVDVNSIKGNFINFAIGGQDIFFSYQVFRHIYETCRFPEKIKYCFIGVSPYIFQYEMAKTKYNEIVAMKYYSFVGKMGHYPLQFLYKAAYHEQKERLDCIMREDFEELYLTTKEKEFLEYERKLGTVVYDHDSLTEEQKAVEKAGVEKEYHKDYPLTVEYNKKYLREYLQYLKERKIQVIMVMPPMADVYKKYMSWDMYEETMDTLNEYQKEYGFTFVNLLMDMDLEDRFFRNPSHLNWEGAKVVTAELNKYIDLDEE